MPLAWSKFALDDWQDLPIEDWAELLAVPPPIPRHYPKPPAGLDGVALDEFYRVCRELDSLYLLNSADRAILGIYARTWAIYDQAFRSVLENGPIVQYSNGTMGPSPQYKVQKETANLLKAYLIKLGLTPTSRKAEAPEKDLDF